MGSDRTRHAAGFQQVPQLPPGPSSSAAVCKPEPSHVPFGTAAQLTPSQRGELELAKQRAERAAQGRKPAGTKRQRQQVVEDFSDDGSDSDLDFSKLSPDEQEKLINEKLANGQGHTDKDARRLKRLLRNRVSAQQARERKKYYVQTLEEQVKDQQAKISELEGRVKDVEQQNEVLRNIIKSIRATDASAQASNQPNTMLNQNVAAPAMQLQPGLAELPFFSDVAVVPAMPGTFDL